MKFLVLPDQRKDLNFLVSVRLISYNNIETFGQDADDGVDSTVDSSGYPLAANQCLHDNDDYEVEAGEDPQVHREQASEVSFSTII